MIVSLYATLETESSFDGHRARTHLIGNLAMHEVRLNERRDISKFFGKWMNKYEACINVHPSGPVFLVPDQWWI
jgi:hypothetical protein